MRERAAAQKAKRASNKLEQLNVSKSKYMQIRSLKDRRTTTVRGVTGYDRRKRNRRALLDNAVVFVPVAPREYAEPQADNLDFTIPKR